VIVPAISFQPIEQTVQVRKHAQRTVAIEGYTDSVGTDSLNQALSEKRAIAVKSGLIDRGVASNRVTARGLGEASPVASNDTAAGRQEIMYRRIGRNELTAIEVCRGYVEAQHTYALTKHDGAIVNQYAQRIISTPGKHDGLAWQNADGTWGGTIGERAARHRMSRQLGGDGRIDERSAGV